MQFFYDVLRSWGLFPPWFGIALLASQILALLTIPSVLLERAGRPRAALSWLLALFAVPALGLLSWWAFGRMSIERKRRKRAARSRHFSARRGPAHTELGTPFDGLLSPRALGDSVFTSTGNAVELLPDGETAFPAMEEVIRSAKRTLHVMFYIFRDDATGRRLRDLLAERARSGVTVRVLVDAWGSPRFAGRFSDPLRAAGAKVAAFLPSHFMPIQAPRFNFANHRKLVVADETVAVLGGMNVGDEYRSEWRDVMARVDGPAARALDHVFLDDWFFASDEEVSHSEKEHGQKPGGASCAIVASGPDRESYIHDAFFVLFTQAVKRIWIVTPYFIPPDAILTALRTSASRGVDVRVLVPKKTDFGVVKYAARSYYRELLIAGAKVFEYEGPMLHAKALVVDDDVSIVGSANVDTRSFRLSFEICCIVKDAHTCGRLSRWYEELLGNSDEVTQAECLSWSTRERLLQSAAHLFSPLL